MSTPEIDGQTTVDEQLATVTPNLDAISDAEAAEIAGPQINLPMQSIVLQGANLRIAKDDQTGEKAIIVGPIVFNFVLPFTEESARQVGRDLNGGIEIASAVPGGPFFSDAKPKIELSR